MRSTCLASAAALLVFALVLPSAAAHTGAIPVPGPKRCYVFETHTILEFWVESNGITTGGTPVGTGTTNHEIEDLGLLGTWNSLTGGGSGLQRSAGDHDGDGDVDPADTKMSDAGAWALACATP